MIPEAIYSALVASTRKNKTLNCMYLFEGMMTGYKAELNIVVSYGPRKQWINAIKSLEGPESGSVDPSTIVNWILEYMETHPITKLRIVGCDTRATEFFLRNCKDTQSVSDTLEMISFPTRKKSVISLLTSIELSTHNTGKTEIKTDWLKCFEGAPLKKLVYSSNWSNNIDPILKFLSPASTLKKLDISENEFKYYDIAYLAKILETNTSLTSLNISRNQCSKPGYKAVKAICSMLKKNIHLQTLIMADCQLDATECKMLFTSLLENQGIRTLTLSGNRFGCGTELGKLLAQNRLESLYMDKMNITDFDVMDFWQGLETCTNLCYLSMEHNKITSAGGEMIFKALLPLQYLKHVSMTGCSMGQGYDLELEYGPLKIGDLNGDHCEEEDFQMIQFTRIL